MRIEIEQCGAGKGHGNRRVRPDNELATKRHETLQKRQKRQLSQPRERRFGFIEQNQSVSNQPLLEKMQKRFSVRTSIGVFAVFTFQRLFLAQDITASALDSFGVLGIGLQFGFITIGECAQFSLALIDAMLKAKKVFGAQKKAAVSSLCPAEAQTFSQFARAAQRFVAFDVESSRRCQIRARGEGFQIRRFAGAIFAVEESDGVLEFKRFKAAHEGQIERKFIARRVGFEFDAIEVSHGRIDKKEL